MNDPWFVCFQMPLPFRELDRDIHPFGNAESNEPAEKPAVMKADDCGDGGGGGSG